MATEKPDKVLFEGMGKVGIIRLNRPRVMNCLDPETLSQFKKHLENARSEKKIRVVMICGNGKAFSAGMDLKYAKDKPVETLKGVNYQGLVETFSYLQHFPKPTIAVIDGYALGGGLELALSCDFRFASKEHASLGFPEINLGILPTWGGLFLPIGVVGVSRTMEYVMTGKRLDAEAAHAVGLVNFVVPHDQLFEEALAFAKGLARKGSFLLQLAKYVIQKGVQATHEERIKFTTLAVDLEHAGAEGEARLSKILNEEK